jgi:hypothetical protein
LVVQNPASFANHPCSSRSSPFALARSMQGKRSSQKRQKEKPAFFFPRCHLFYLPLAKSVPSSEKRRKIYRGIKKQECKPRSSLFAFSNTNKPKRKQTGKMRRSSRPCSGRFKKPQEPPRKTYPFFLRFAPPKQSRNCKTPVLFWMINVCRVRFCVGSKKQGY